MHFETALKHMRKGRVIGSESTPMGYYAITREKAGRSYQIRFFYIEDGLLKSQPAHMNFLRIFSDDWRLLPGRSPHLSVEDIANLTKPEGAFSIDDMDIKTLAALGLRPTRKQIQALANSETLEP
jgi:hypothetical protein